MMARLPIAARLASTQLSSSRLLPLARVQPRCAALLRQSLMQQVRCYAERTVQVPQMAESISEGTLKQWAKSVGDYVEADEEIATIETDKV
jgi:2-oxoglutarate dehydrogenase E2 component (dihydrolipoamide succinyltransferase)